MIVEATRAPRERTKLRRMTAAAVGALALAAGCASAPPEPRNHVPATALAAPGLRSGSEPSPASATAAPARGPLTLEAAVAIALERNPDIRAAVERIGAADARLGEASAAFYPQVTGRLSVVRSDNPLQAFGMIVAERRFSPSLDVNHPGATEDWRPEVAANLSLFRGGQDWQGRAAAKLGVEAAGLERDAIRNALADAVAAAYYGALAAGAQVGVARASIAAVTGELGDARARVEAGKALRSDALSLEVRLAAAQEAEVRARNAVELAHAALRMLLALGADEPVTLADAGGPSSVAPPATFAGALARALAERPEIAAAGRLVAIREHEVSAQRGAYLPRVSAFGSYGQDAPDLELSRHQDSWTVGGMVELDIFSGFATAERVAGAEHRLAEARIGDERARLEVERDVRTAFLALGEARERVRVSEAATAAGDEALRLVGEQYRAGAVTVTRYLEAEAAAADVRSRASAARFDARRAEAGLVRAVGGWK